MERRKFLSNSFAAGSLAMVHPVHLLNDLSFLKKSKISFGVCTGFENYQTVAKAGYSYIEDAVRRLLIPAEPEEKFEENLKLVKESEIPVKACNFFLPGSLKSTGNEAVHDQILEYSETAFRRARKAGVEIIVFGSGGSRNIPGDFSKEEAKQQFIDLCKSMGPIAGKYGVTVVIEPLNRNECNFINSVLEGAEIVEETNHPNIRLLADIYHMKMENEGPESIIEKGQLIKHTHVAEKEGRTPPGVNHEDLGPYINALEGIGYRGRMSVEARWDNFEQQVGPALEELNKYI